MVPFLFQNLDGFLESVKRKTESPHGSFFILCILEQEASAARSALKNWGDVSRGKLSERAAQPPFN